MEPAVSIRTPRTNIKFKPNTPITPGKKKIKKLFVRHYPPGFQVEFVDGSKTSIEICRQVLEKMGGDSIEECVDEIIKVEPVLQSKSKRQDKIKLLVAKCLNTLIETKNIHSSALNDKKFKVAKVLKAHVLPLTNVAFNKSGSLFLTASYDRTAKIWPVDQLISKSLNLSSDFKTNSYPTSPVNTTKPVLNNNLNSTIFSENSEPLTLSGHANVVFTVAFNNPFGDKVATGSFDRTAKIWSTKSGKCLQTLRGHSREVVCLGFNGHYNNEKMLLATGSVDSKCGLWKVHNENLDIETEINEPCCWLAGHSSDVIALHWEPNEYGSKLITGSFDRTAAIWDIEGMKDMSTPLFTLIGHREELSSVHLDYTGSMAITGSMDKTARIWDLRSGSCVSCLRGHSDEVLDVCFSNDRFYAATGGADKNACLYDLRKLVTDQPDIYGECISSGLAENILRGHKSEISVIKFNPASTHLLTVSADNTAKLWRADTGQLVQTLEGHSDELFSCAFNYHGDIIITGSKDNTCRIWTLEK